MNSDLKRFANLLVNTFGLDVIVVKQFISNVEFFGDPFDLAIAGFDLIFTRKSGHPFKLHTLSVQTHRENNNTSMLNIF